MNMDNYIIYARKSSEQEERQALSIDSQIAELKDISKRLKLRVSDVLSEAKSAKEVGRPIFEQMLSKILSHESRKILVWHPDRLSRNPHDSATIVALLDSGDLLEVVTPSQTFRNSPMDKFMLGFFMMQAKFENDSKGVNVVRGLKTKAEKGWLPSGAKAGYMNDRLADKGNKTILSDPDRFPLIRKAWDAMLTGTYTVMQILSLLNDEWGYRTPKHKRIGGKPMTRSQIYKTLTDPFYYGEFEYPVGSGSWHNGKHEPMITKQEFDRVQRLLGRNNRPLHRSHSHDYAGLLRCGGCDGSISPDEKYQTICSNCKYKFASLNQKSCPKCSTLIEEMKNPTLLHYVYYRCGKRKDPNCTQTGLEAKKLENEFDTLLSKLQISERFKDWAVKYLNEVSDKETEENIVTLKSLQAAKVDCESRLNNLLKMKISPQNTDGSMLSDEVYKKQKELLTVEKSKIDEQLGGNSYHAEKWRETAEKSFDFASHARYWFANGDIQTRREILAGLGSNLILINKTVRVDLVKNLQFIELAIKGEPSISEMFEPKEKTDNTIQLESLWTKSPTLLLDLDSNQEPSR